MKLHNVRLDGLEVVDFHNKKGSHLIATSEISEEGSVLITVPQELVLSLDNVWIYAKSDKHLLQVLEAVGDYARVRVMCG